MKKIVVRLLTLNLLIGSVATGSFFFFSSLSMHGVRGEIAPDPFWTAAGSPYVFEDNVTLPTLTVDVSISPTIAVSMGNVSVEVHVTNGTDPVEEVSLQLMSDKGGNFEPSSGLTDLSGGFSSTYFAPEVLEDTIIKITADASKPGYAETSKDVLVPVVAPSTGETGSVSPWISVPIIVVAAATVIAVFFFRKSRRRARAVSKRLRARAKRDLSTD